LTLPPLFINLASICVLPSEFDFTAIVYSGLIGLLVTAVLSMQSPSLTSSSDCFGSVTAFDALDDRLRVSSSVGVLSALKPDMAAAAGPFDCSIEVSGNPRALQSAIDHTSNNGRIVVGS
jgi:threonine dehydrogenase-like Zn-dependent dehydrogenase